MSWDKTTIEQRIEKLVHAINNVDGYKYLLGDDRDSDNYAQIMISS